MNIHRFAITMLMGSTLWACAANPLTPGAEKVRILDVSPDVSKATCAYVGEVTGTQGSVFSGPYTSNENLIVGARNDIKNKALKLGANAVFIQHQADPALFRAGGTVNSTVVGAAYLCK